MSCFCTTTLGRLNHLFRVQRSKIFPIHTAAEFSTSTFTPSENRRILGNESWNEPKSVSATSKKYDWLAYNDRIHLPQIDDISGEYVHRPAYICHMRSMIKYSPKRMWYYAGFVRGMTIDEALKQLSFIDKKGAVIVGEVLREAQDLAVSEHNVEFKSNLWVAESFMMDTCHRIKGFRRHARMRMGVVEYKYINYYVRLEEGKPPKHYYHYRAPKSPQQWLEGWLDEHRKKKILWTEP